MLPAVSLALLLGIAVGANAQDRPNSGLFSIPGQPSTREGEPPISLTIIPSVSVSGVVSAPTTAAPTATGTGTATGTDTDTDTGTDTETDTDTDTGTDTGTAAPSSRLTILPTGHMNSTITRTQTGATNTGGPSTLPTGGGSTGPQPTKVTTAAPTSNPAAMATAFANNAVAGIVALAGLAVAL